VALLDKIPNSSHGIQPEKFAALETYLLGITGAAGQFG
jgi:hypothetical protein